MRYPIDASSEIFEVNRNFENTRVFAEEILDKGNLFLKEVIELGVKNGVSEGLDLEGLGEFITGAKILRDKSLPLKGIVNKLNLFFEVNG
jgi:hypothetical protein